MTDDARRSNWLFRWSIGVFFIGGFLTAFVSLLVPRMTLVLGLDYSRALLVSLAFYSAYLLFAIPVTAIILRIGYMRAVATGLSVMAGALALLFVGVGWRFYPVTLGALLLMSLGITFLQISSNTVVVVTGDAARAAFRLTLLQGFNSIGTVLGPLAGASYLLGSGVAAGWVLAPPFVFAGVLLAVLAGGFIRSRNLLPRDPPVAPIRFDWRGLLRERRLIAGAGAIFAYVGAEVTLGTLATDFLVRADVMALSPVAAARFVALYWAGAMIGRLGGAALLSRRTPSRVLLGVALLAVLLVVIAAGVRGQIGAAALLAIGLCNAIMYPTIYVLALPKAAGKAIPASTVLCMAVVGGAVLPLLTGMLIDQVGFIAALLLPALCYLVVAHFAWTARRVPA